MKQDATSPFNAEGPGLKKNIRKGWLPSPSSLSSFMAKRILPSSTYSASQLQEVENSFHFFWDKKLKLTHKNLEKCQSWIVPFLPLSIENLNIRIQRIREYFSPRSFAIKTPDNALLHGTFFQNTQSLETDLPTIIIFSASGELHKMGSYSWIFDFADKDFLFNVLAFDYRGTGESMGKITCPGLIMDGCCILEYLNSLHVSSKNFILYGFSLGAAIAAEAAGIYGLKEGKIILDRTFSSLRELISHLLGNGLFGTCISRILAWMGWDLNILRQIKKISSQRLILYSIDDLVIPFKKSLYRALEKKDSLQNVNIVQLKEIRKKGEEPHNLPLPFFCDAKGTPVKDIFLKFISH